MAKIGGCNTEFKTMSKPQGAGRMSPASFNRKNMSMGGVNDKMNGAKDKVAVGAGGASQGKNANMPKGY